MFTDAMATFAAKLQTLKSQRPEIEWYPSLSLDTLHHWLPRFSGPGRSVFDELRSTRVIDLGAADGDVGFFCEILGAQVTLVDNAAMNLNDCVGMGVLKAALGSNARLHLTDMDWQPWLPGPYDLAILLGVLYHLRNPFLVLHTIAHHAERLLTNTKVIGRLAGGEYVADQPLAYLTYARELANNATNYWLMTPAALRLMLKRCGWVIKDEFLTADISAATPTGPDCRMYLYCERVPHWRDLRIHHDF